MTSEISTMLGVTLPAIPPDTAKAIKDCTIPLPVRREDQHRVDEKYAEHGRGSLDQRMGTDWNQQEE